MKVQELMTHDVKRCRPGDNLAEAATMMWDNDCGVIPVTDEAGKVLGMLTDRDICMAVVTRNQRASEIAAAEVVTGEVFGCPPEAELAEALRLMQEKRVRRIPVFDKDRVLRGILSINDIVLSAIDKRFGTQTDGVGYDEAMNLLKSVSEHRHTSTQSDLDQQSRRAYT